jgi:signal transduction histidine kinase
MNAVRRFFPLERITTQIAALLVVAGIASASVIGLTVLLLLPEREAPTPAHEIAARIGTILRALEKLPRATRLELAAVYSGGDIVVTIGSPQVVEATQATVASDFVWPMISRELPRGTILRTIESEGLANKRIVIELSDGELVAFHFTMKGVGPLPVPLVIPLVFLVASTVLLSVWAIRKLVAPLSRFADAVEQFGVLDQTAPLREEGPVEIRKATNAFNRMRSRILELIDDRTQMMMAVSHDLRTPLTRLRLRVEYLSGNKEKERMLRDIEMMDSSITQAVTFLRQGEIQEAVEMSDLPSLVETICDQFSDAGHAVQYQGPRHLAALCRPQSLGSAITNLVDNGTKFGTSVLVRLSISTPNVACIEVEDDGPGIPDSEKAFVLEPFYRSDPARQKSGGFGLGLAIALKVARLHDGTLTLHDNRQKGLRARLCIPLQGPSAISG